METKNCVDRYDLMEREVRILSDQNKVDCNQFRQKVVHPYSHSYI